jgi:formate-dependent nitrite reductase membrane component NrfD
MWGLAVFIVFVALYIAPQLEWFAWLPWTSGAIAGRIMLGIAVVAGFWVMIYTGFVMAQSPSIALWNTPILPALFMLYGLIGGIDLAFISVAVLGNTAAIDIKLLEAVQIALFTSCLIFIWAYLGLMSGSRVGAREAVRMIAKGELAFIFWGVVIVIGLIIPLAVALYAYFVGVAIAVTGGVGLLALVGCLYFRHVVLRAGVYSPLI